MELDKPIKDSLKPRFAPFVVAAASIDISHEEVTCIGWGLGEKGYLA